MPDEPTLDSSAAVALREIFLGRRRDISTLIERIRFLPKEGGIWFNDEAAVLMRGQTFQRYRRALYETLGEAEARRLMIRVAFDAGAEDAALALELRGDLEISDIIAAGPAIIALQGFGTVGAGGMQAEVSADHFALDVIWEHSVEAEWQVRDQGIGVTPACNFNTGYAIGFLSNVLGKPVVCREVECEAMGHSRCRFIAAYRETFQSLEPEYAELHDQPATVSQRRLHPASPRSSATPSNGFETAPHQTSETNLVGESAGFLSAIHMLERVAPTDATVLLLGESGVGKEGFAKNLHRLSRRSAEPFVAVNCAAIPENLLEAELFGAEKGSYTGASIMREGRFERADKGTLFLDEIATLSLTAQGKLLRVLQEGQLERLGARRTIDVDVRIVAATNVNLRAQVEHGEFRDDLYYRLNVFPIQLPPLRARREDVPILMDVFLAKFSSRHGKPTRGFSQEARDAMMTYDWPGNIRELENLVERAVILVTEGETIQVAHLFTSGEHVSSQIYRPTDSGPLAIPAEGSINWTDVGTRALETPAPLETLERALLSAALSQSDGNISKAARILKMSRGQLNHRLRRLKHSD